MTDTAPEHLTLAAEFEQASLQQWRDLVADVVGTHDATAPEEELASTTYDGIPVGPLYTAAGAPPSPGFPGFAPYVRGSDPAGSVERGWDVRAWHGGPDPGQANEAIRTDLDSGVSSLWVALGEGALPTGVLGQALDGVQLDLAPIVLDPGTAVRAGADALLGLYAERGVPTTQRRGNLGADPIGLRAARGSGPALTEAAELAARVTPEHPELRSIVVDARTCHDAGSSDAEELGYSLAAGVAYLRALTEAGLPAAQAAGSLEFRYAAGADQFLTIAKFRAARQLWSRVCAAAGITAAAAAQRQHAVTSHPMMTVRDPWVNMLRSTLACFSAGVGGAAAVTVEPFDSALGVPDDFGRRIARNTQSILLAESKLAGVIDPAGGSYYVEAVTDSMARQSWAFFQDVEAHGGVLAALDSGYIAERIGETWARRRAAIAHRRDPITGVSEYPDLSEEPLAREPKPAGPGGGLPRVRYAQEFEHLRARAEAHAERPTVFLAVLGTEAEHSARVGFAANLLAAGGIAGHNPGAVDDVVAAYRTKPLPVVCVCGTEAAYDEHLGELVPALREAGAGHVWLSGKQTERRAAIVDGFLQRGCDAVAVCESVQAELGVS
jgi:methylmalonyl-CoA mutase